MWSSGTVGLENHVEGRRQPTQVMVLNIELIIISGGTSRLGVQPQPKQAVRLTLSAMVSGESAQKIAHPNRKLSNKGNFLTHLNQRLQHQVWHQQNHQNKTIVEGSSFGISSCKVTMNHNRMWRTCLQITVEHASLKLDLGSQTKKCKIQVRTHYHVKNGGTWTLKESNILTFFTSHIEGIWRPARNHHWKDWTSLRWSNKSTSNFLAGQKPIMSPMGWKTHSKSIFPDPKLLIIFTFCWRSR